LAGDAADICAAQASLNLSPEEKRVYGGLFKEADSEGLNVVTGDIAVKFFERTKLDPGHLAQVRPLHYHIRLSMVLRLYQNRYGRLQMRKTRASYSRQASASLFA